MVPYRSCSHPVRTLGDGKGQSCWPEARVLQRPHSVAPPGYVVWLAQATEWFQSWELPRVLWRSLLLVALPGTEGTIAPHVPKRPGFCGYTNVGGLEIGRVEPITSTARCVWVESKEHLVQKPGRCTTY